MSETKAKKKNPLLIGALLVLSSGYGGFKLWQTRQPYEWSGTVEARTVAVGSRAGGRVREVRVTEGDPVDKDKVLIVLEPGDWRAQLLDAQGQLKQAQANLDKLKKGARPEELEGARARAMSARAAFEETRAGARPEQVAAAAARLEAQEAALQKAKLDAARFHKLAAAGAAAPADVDNANSTERAAAAQRDALAQQLDELKNGSRREDLTQAQARELEQSASEKLLRAGTRVEDIAAAEGQLESARGRLDRIQSMVDELEIRAPASARIEALNLRPGDILAPNATAATLLEDGQLYVRIYVPETLLGHLKVGDKVPVSVDSFPSKSFEGVVEHINGVGEYSPRNLQTADERADQVFAARIGLRTGVDQLRAGMAAFIRVTK